MLVDRFSLRLLRLHHHLFPYVDFRPYVCHVAQLQAVGWHCFREHLYLGYFHGVADALPLSLMAINTARFCHSEFLKEKIEEYIYFFFRFVVIFAGI